MSGNGGGKVVWTRSLVRGRISVSHVYSDSYLTSCVSVLSVPWKRAAVTHRRLKDRRSLNASLKQTLSSSVGPKREETFEASGSSSRRNVALRGVDQGFQGQPAGPVALL